MKGTSVALLVFAIAFVSTPALAQHHEYQIEVSNHTRQDLHVSCHDESSGTEETTDVHAGEHADIHLHGDEHLHVHCTASDHNGNQLASREFEFSHRRRSSSWRLTAHRDHHDH